MVKAKAVARTIVNNDSILKSGNNNKKVPQI